MRRNLFSRVMSKLDPFDNVGLVLSPIAAPFRRMFYKQGSAMLFAFALLCVPFLHGMAAPVVAFKSHAAAKTSLTVFNRLGYTGALLSGGVFGATQQQLLPFRYGTTRRRLTVGTYTFTPGQAIPTITIPQVGMMSRIIVSIAGTYTKANATGLNLYDGYDALLGRAQVKLNNGSSQLVDLSGVGISILNKNQSPALPIKRGLLTNAAAQTFAYQFILPISANTREQFTLGLVNLQAPELRCTLDLVANPIASVFATAADVTAFTATATVAYEWFEIPDLRKFALPPVTIVRSIEEAPVPVGATGDQTYQIPRLGTMIDYHAVAVFNNVYANALSAFTNWKLKYNKSDTQYDIRIQEQETYEAELYGMGIGTENTFLDPHVISVNLWAAGNRPWDGGDFRDAVDTEENTTTESIVTVSATQALNAGKDNIFHVRRVMQRIVQAPAPA